jgi:hypothetical protein
MFTQRILWVMATCSSILFLLIICNLNIIATWAYNYFMHRCEARSKFSWRPHSTAEQVALRRIH